MKFFFLSTMFLSIGLYAGAPIHQGAGYAPNDGKTPPGTFTSKPSSPKGTGVSAAPVTSESGMTNSSGVTTNQMNTSPNAAPATDEDARKDATLSSGETYDTGPYSREGTFDPKKPDELEAQEENALDYSTTPKKRTTTPLGPNKK